MKEMSFLIFLVSLFSCSYVPEISDDVEKILTDDAIIIKIDKDAFQKDTDVHVNVDINNKDIPRDGS